MATTYNDTATGGIRAGGSTAISVITSITASGGVRCGGVVSLTSNWHITGSGGGLLGGSIVQSNFFNYIATGGALAGGVAIKESPVYHYPNMIDWDTLGPVIGSDPLITVTRHYNAGVTGRITMGAQAAIRLAHHYIADGLSDDKPPEFSGVSVGYLNYLNPAIITYKFNYDYNFIWRNNKSFTIDRTFLWNTGNLQSYWYRIVGKGKADKCPPVQVNDQCCMRYVVNIHARTLEELCGKLQKRRWKWPIESVQKFSRPAQNSVAAVTEGLNEDCNTTTTVEICQIPKCADFCVDFDLTETWGANSFSRVEADKTAVGSGGIIMGGIANCRFAFTPTVFTYEMGNGDPEERSITMGGEAGTLSSSYNYTMVGGIAVFGEAYIRSTAWEYVGGVWPLTNSYIKGTTTDQVTGVGASPQPWTNPEQAITADSNYAYVNLNYGNESDFLIIRGFDLDIPSNANILGLEVKIIRYSNFTVRDRAVFMVVGDEIVSDSLATNTNWSLIPGTATYGSNTTQWRNSSDPDYLGEWDTDDLNSPEFGIAIAVKPITIAGPVFAFIDSVYLTVYYDLKDKQTIRTGGSAYIRSNRWKYTGTGGVTVGGGQESDLNIKRTYRYISSGLGSVGPNFSGVTMGGTYGRHFHYDTESEDGIEMGGAAGMIASHYQYTMDGGVEIGGEAGVKSCAYSWAGSGGITMAGEAGLRNTFRYIAGLSGGITVGGDGQLSRRFRPYTMVGGILMDGEALVKSSHYSYVMGGGITMGGTPDVTFSDLGTLETVVGVIAEALSVQLIFKDAVAQTLALPTETVSRCNCRTLPLLLQFKHNMVQTGKFAQFLSRNNFVMPTIIDMMYNKTNDSWQSNLHYHGLSISDIGFNELWNLVFEMKCTDIAGGESIATSFWKFSMTVKQKRLSTSKESESKLIVGFLPDNICNEFKDMNLTMTVDTQADFVTVVPDSTVYEFILYDNIGLFKNTYWELNPNLRIGVSEVGFQQSIPRYNFDSVLNR
jgi:hypothetical protein